MGFLSSLFSFGDKPTTSTTTYRPVIPEELKPYVKEILEDQQILYQQRMDEGYQPYTGETIAPLTPEQIAAQEGLKSLVGTQAPLQQEALNLARGATEEFTADTAKKYMSPYLRASLDAQKAEAQRQYERTKVPEFEAQAVRAGGMSGLGTRAAVEAAERATGQQRLLADIEAKGQQKAFEAAQQQFENQQARERQAAAQISTAAPQIFKSGVAEQGLLQTIGEDKRRLGQSALDEAYARYIEQQQFPETQLARYQSAIYGNPLLKQRSGTVTGTQTGGGPGLGKTLLGLGTTALGFGTGGGNTLGGTLFGKMFGKAGGGRVTEGLTATMQARPYVNYMRRNMGGQVVPPVVYRQDSSLGYRPPSGPPTRGTTGEKYSFLGGKRKPREVSTGGENPEIIRDIKKNIENIQRVNREKAAEAARIDESGLAGIGNVPYADKFKPNETAKKDAIKKIGTSSTDTTQTDINKFLEKEGVGRTSASDVSDAETGITVMERLGRKIIGYQDGRPIYGDPEPTKKEGTIGGLTQKDVAKGARENIEGKAKALGEQAVKSGELSKAVVDKITARNKSFFDKIEKRIGDNPYKRQKFWFTVGASIMKKGNAFANLVNGLEKATNALDVDRKEKNELLNELDENRRDTANELDKTKLASDLKALGITTKQKKLLAGRTAAEQKAMIDLIKAGATFKTAEAAVIRAEAAKIKAGLRDPLGASDSRALNKNVRDALNNIASAYFREGVPIKGEALKYFNNINAAYQRLFQEQGSVIANQFLNNTVSQDLPRFKKMFETKKNKGK
jgi:hypothetical protein